MSSSVRSSQSSSLEFLVTDACPAAGASAARSAGDCQQKERSISSRRRVSTCPIRQAPTHLIVARHEAGGI